MENDDKQQLEKIQDELSRIDASLKTLEPKYLPAVLTSILTAALILATILIGQRSITKMTDANNLSAINVNSVIDSNHYTLRPYVAFEGNMGINNYHITLGNDKLTYAYKIVNHGKTPAHVKDFLTEIYLNNTLVNTTAAENGKDIIVFPEAFQYRNEPFTSRLYNSEKGHLKIKSRTIYAGPKEAFPHTYYTVTEFEVPFDVTTNSGKGFMLNVVCQDEGICSRDKRKCEGAIVCE